jgi:hypothetical protein
MNVATVNLALRRIAKRCAGQDRATTGADKVGEPHVGFNSVASEAENLANVRTEYSLLECYVKRMPAIIRAQVFSVVEKVE